MPFLGGRRGADHAAPRDYVLTGEPVVTADSFVVLVDLVVRYEQSHRPDGAAFGWDPAAETAINAVAVTALRVEAGRAGRDEAVAERTRLADPVLHALSLAPVPAGFTPTLVSFEVRPHEPIAPSRSEFRVVG
ncbi:hypothetical protein GCM10011376_14980 [Nocardioides flavus (ex Wang et al. 2016)]|uniref:Uncharacterized protein n=1 Tax=Nocardioides flavus (ex Wang et al. 2016) TaxID=2058780 RepID=A0ABQ3HGY6_9ACTN|nr:hypothetical protein [Nocardioides flavus (ex Wang et al. 2016)]GHE16888.1 hypothetical protein GCM10011376_14980 [Nocardioides flavus (ex Wang et al. 2016)]